MPSRYKTPRAFKAALEHRIKKLAAERGADNPNRIRQQLIFERYMVRLDAIYGDNLTLKGGMALLLRNKRARTTKDLDIHLFGRPEDALKKLQRAGQRDEQDYMTFRIESANEIQAEGLPYEGLRFQAECRLANKIYGARFPIDIAFAEELLDEPEWLNGSDIWTELGLDRPRIHAYPISTHIAEKFHAYTLPRESNTRVKDLPDLALLAGQKTFEATHLLQVIRQRFEERDTHEVPESFPEPPSTWADTYEKMAEEYQLQWITLEDAYEAVASFLDPVLEGSPGQWSPSQWVWLES